MKIEAMESMESVHEHLSAVSRKNGKHVSCFSPFIVSRFISKVVLANFCALKREECLGLPRKTSVNWR